MTPHGSNAGNIKMTPAASDSSVGGVSLRLNILGRAESDHSLSS